MGCERQAGPSAHRFGTALTCACPVHPPNLEVQPLMPEKRRGWGGPAAALGSTGEKTKGKNWVMNEALHEASHQ